jgi:diguanylate cyclase (GGDEF)-like protein
MVELALVLVGASLGLAAAGAVHDGRRRLREALERLAQLEHECDRVHVALDRLGRALQGGLDRRTAVEVALGTTVDAVAAAAGRARLAGSSDARIFEAVPHRPGAGDADALLAAERAALAGHRGHEFHDGWWALGSPLLPCREEDADPIGAIAVCRYDAPFSREEEDLFGYLAAQTAASLEAIALYERVGQARDEVTGLANHRHFQEILAARVDESLRSGKPLSLLLIDLDDFRSLNAALGHGTGDEVLHAVAQAVRRRCRTSDEPARFAGQQIAVAVPGADLDEAWLVAEDLRSAIAALEFEAGGEWLNVTASIGIVELSQRVASREGLIFAAETALDEAKRAGRNRAVGFRGPYRDDDAWVREVPGR